MDFLMQKAQKEFGFSDREISLIQYSILSICYDFSKILLFSVFFYVTGKFINFLFALVPFLFLRCKNGGLHFKTYLGCVTFSFIYLYLVINVLPVYITLPLWAVCVIVVLCAVINYIVGPTSLNRKKEKSADYIRKTRIQTLVLTGAIALLILASAQTTKMREYSMVCFWTLVLHALQMAITPKMKEVKYREELG